MSAAKEIDVEAWKRNLRAAPLDDDDACTRWFNNYFAFWHVCETGACRRNKRCAGDPKACSDRFMPLVPQRMKFELQATLKAINDKLPLDSVRRKAKEEMARFDETTRVLERLGMRSAGAPQTALSPRPAKRGEGGERSEPGEGKGPRVRML